MSQQCAEKDLSCSGQDLFKEEFKRYKRRKPAPDFSDVIDFSKPSANIEEHCLGEDVLADENMDRLCEDCGLRAASSWKVFKILSKPGFFYIVNPFKCGFQRRWVQRCLHDYPQLPNVSNLDAHVVDRPSCLWRDALEHRKSDSHGWLSGDTLIQRLRWVTLGYHYDWTNKVYYKDKVSPMPGDVDKLCTVMARMLKFNNFTAEAGIVNFYHLDSTLSGHTDHSEFDLTAPLFSISFGQDAVFLLGGHNRSTRPVAMFVRSGDAMVMSGEARMAYHSVPRVLPTTVHSLASDAIVSDADWTPYAEYMSSSRVNLNIRQVLRPGKGFPENPYPNLCDDPQADTSTRNECVASGKSTPTANDLVRDPSPLCDTSESSSPKSDVQFASVCADNNPKPELAAIASAVEPSCKRILLSDSPL